MSFSPLGGRANSVPLNPLDGYEGPLQDAGREKKVEERGEKGKEEKGQGTSTNWRQSLFCCCTASMEQATDGAETAAIDGLVSS